MPSANKTRSMCWTLNNPTQEEIDHIKNGPFKFIVFQEEVGASGTHHLQGYCQMGNPTGFNSWRKLVSPKAHFTVPDGSPRSNFDYCTKAETRKVGTEPFHRGEVPQPGQRTDIDGLVLLAKDPTKRMRDLVDSNGEGFVKLYKGLQVVRSIFSEPRKFQTEVYWLYGTTGTGKSRFAWEVAPDAYSKPGGTNWWDGYDPIEHTDVIIDDFRANMASFSEILRLFDRYPMQVPFKGGYVNFRPRRVYVTTSRPPVETWLTTGEEAMEQLLRRLKVIVEFLPGGFKRFVKGTVADLQGAGHLPLVDPALGIRPPSADSQDVDELYESDVDPSEDGDRPRPLPPSGGDRPVLDEDFLFEFDDNIVSI